jgi:hypothetical protein
MDLTKVLFIGGDPQAVSVRIRCVEMANRLGCKYHLRSRLTETVMEQYRVFVCVKPRLWSGQLEKLARRGMVVWDIVDEAPPKEHVARYLTSSEYAREIFSAHGRVEMIPHRHCNFSGEPNPPENRRPAWIGHQQWHPPMPGVAHDQYFVEHLTSQAVWQAYRKTGVGLNLRIPGRKHEFHVAINSGIKLINCMGYGIPSISSDEPAYREFGDDCTIFSTPKGCAKWVKALQSDDDLYHELRRNCLRRAPQFHIDSSVAKYQSLLQSL